MNGILFTPNTKFEAGKMMHLIFPSFKEILPALIDYDDEEEEKEVYDDEEEIVFDQEQFDNIVKNVYDTYAKIPFDTDEEWEFIMKENTKFPETDVLNDDDDIYSDDDEFYVT